jgi:hypothetical protein
MQIKHRETFITVKTEGAILPADLLQRIIDRDRDLPGLNPESYHLSGEQINEAINRSWSRLQAAWQNFWASASMLQEKETGTHITRERWLLILFQEFGYGRLTTQKAIEIEGKSYPVSHFWQKTPIHLIGCSLDLDQRISGVKGAARMSPHSMTQEFLNRSDDHLWAFVSNGLKLRILRDSMSLTRQAFVEFDLETMMKGDIYSDFVILWMLCHQSGVEAENPYECRLEKWSKSAYEKGTRALDQLRSGVEKAIESAGKGFLRHAANSELKQAIKTGAMIKQDYYRQILRLIYRLIFLFVAEDRDLLILPETDIKIKNRYLNYYSLRRLRHLAEQKTGTQHHDLYQGLKLIFNKLSAADGCPELGLPSLGSHLFTEKTTALLNHCEMSNRYLLDTIRSISYITYENKRRPVDYRHLGSEELGSVYESLLELHPEMNVDAGIFSLKTAGGHERKTTGSYYTHSSLVQSLLQSALDPVLDDACKTNDPESAILNLKICDPACGSGHFLVAAAHRMARRLAAHRTGDNEPSPDAVRIALRDIIGNCIYGVDINPMAVELCKISLWLEAMTPGKPLSFLDHHIQCGNSLLGATPALLKNGIPDLAFKPIEGDDKRFCAQFKRQNNEERSNQGRIDFDQYKEAWNNLGNFAESIYHLNDIDDQDVLGIRKKQALYETMVKSSGYLYGRLWADAWCASFVWIKKKQEKLPYPITEEIFRRIEKNPYAISKDIQEEIQRLSKQYQFFHWQLAFPDVFQMPKKNEPAENEDMGWNGGFDVVLGNPPWERIKLQEKEWFVNVLPEIANAPNAASRRKMITALKTENPIMYNNFLDARRQSEGISHLLRHSNRYPLCGRGDINTYTVFTECNRTIIASKGRVGCVIPSGIASDDTTKFFFQDIMKKRSLVSLYDFENREKIFQAVDSRIKFCLLTLTGSSKPMEKGAEFVFFALKAEDLLDDDRRFVLSAEDIELVNPNTKTCPVFRSQRDAELAKKIYRNVPVLIKEGKEGENPWEIKFMTMFHMANDSDLFMTENDLIEDGWRLDGNTFHKEQDKYLPLYEAKMANQFDHRFSSVIISKKAVVRQGQADYFDLDAHQDPRKYAIPRYWISYKNVKERLVEHENSNILLGFTDVTSPTNERSMLASLIPLSGVGHTLPLIFTNQNFQYLAFLMMNLNSFCLDYVGRQKLGGIHYTYFIVKQLPILAPNIYKENTFPFDSQLCKWLTDRALELVYSAYDIKKFAVECGYNGPPFKWDETRRFLIRCELDAAYFHLYGIARDDVSYIMETFPIVKRKDIAKYGNYHTKETILSIYDDMGECIKTGHTYQTRLDPPPADASMAHNEQEYS